MTLNQKFRDAILANNYKKCVFNPNEEGTEVCHILANSKANVKLAQKYFNCTEREAQDLINIPLLNTVWGSRKANTQYCKTEDIKLISIKLVGIANEIIFDYWHRLKATNQKHDLYEYVYGIYCIFFRLYLLGDFERTEIIKLVQTDFQRKIKAHF